MQQYVDIIQYIERCVSIVFTLNNVTYLGSTIFTRLVLPNYIACTHLIITNYSIATFIIIGNRYWSASLALIYCDLSVARRCKFSGGSCKRVIKNKLSTVVFPKSHTYALFSHSLARSAPTWVKSCWMWKIDKSGWK